MFIDDVTIRVEAGSGGKGAVAFNKNAKSLGPVGGSGGKGGSIYFEGVSDLNALYQFRHKKNIKAKGGADGRGQFRDGHGGADLVLKIPVGSVIHKIDGSTSLTTGGSTAHAIEILEVGERLRIARGGLGGKGNFHFRSSTNTTPMQFEEGIAGERFSVRLELKLIADVGLIGLPNAGKSSLLNELTSAKSKVGNYPFTTLEPNLGVYETLILADIPGLIEGASAGKGLGIKFLRHIERVKTIFHLISAESENPAKDYQTIKNELATYSTELTEKPEYIFLTKSDTMPKAQIKKKIAILKKIHKNVFPISIHDWDSLEKVKKILQNIESGKVV
ncbi:MAG: GTPase ObgE [Candidatus Spechtbacteria bacterium]|nr:GTPase ObgE [Candidatus Spechtbacteria bacterium]